MATVELKSINELFDKRFLVPSYQRGFRWSDTQLKELLEDLYDYAVSIKINSDYYCLQPIVVKENDGFWELVDGQQRLTALWLISALYYCTNKDDVINLQHSHYDLFYQEKDDFTTLFDKISEFIKSSSLKNLRDSFMTYKTLSIDSLYLINCMEFISEFTRNNQTAKGVLAKIFDIIENIKIIWYVLDDKEDAIQTFTNINANKIELTNAELIKASLLYAVNDDNLKQNMALQWEDIEKGLNNNSFWNFIANERHKKYTTRIDYLFEIFCVRREHTINDSDRYSVFRILNTLLSQGKSMACELWRDIQEIYETLNDWYLDYFYYHTIGMLVILKDKDIDTIKNLYNLYVNNDKEKFKAKLLTQIRNIYFSPSVNTPFELFDIDNIKNDLESITISRKYDVRNVLFIYNISMLINANNTYERFPFDLYKNETWDIEHINPQTPKDSSLDEKKAWLLSYKNIIIDKTLLQKMDDCILNNLINFDSLSTEITSALDIADNNSISNLVLLDATTNRGYKNSCFLDKRRKIIDVERNKTNDEKYILIGTKWVFLKGYENSTQLIVWGGSDMQDYTDDITHNIYNMLKEAK